MIMRWQLCRVDRRLDTVRVSGSSPLALAITDFSVSSYWGTQGKFSISDRLLVQRVQAVVGIFNLV
jgi:hypothetical protein